MTLCTMPLDHPGWSTTKSLDEEGSDNEDLSPSLLGEYIPEQKRLENSILEAIRERRDKPLVFVVEGPPGSGKTQLVRNVIAKKPLAKIQCVAYTNQLASSLPPGSFTIHKFMGYRVWNPPDKVFSAGDIREAGPCDPPKVWGWVPHKPDVLVIDEGSMVPLWLMRLVLELCREYETNIIIVLGDRHQVKPVNCKHNIFNCSGLYECFADFEWRHQSLRGENYRFSPKMKAVVSDMEKFVMMDPDANGTDVLAFLWQSLGRDLFSCYPPNELEPDTEVLVWTNRSRHHYDLITRNRDSAVECKLKFALEEDRRLFGPFLYRLQGTFKRCMGDRVDIRLYIYPGQRVRYEGTGDVVRSIADDVVLLEKAGNVPLKKYEISLMDFAKFGTDFARELLSKRESPLSKIVLFQFPLKTASASTTHVSQGQTVDASRVIFDFRGVKTFEPPKDVVYTAFTRIRSVNQISTIVIGKRLYEFFFNKE